MRLAWDSAGALARGPGRGEEASRARLAVCAGFQHWTAPSGRAGGRQRGAGTGGGGPGCSSGSRSGLAAAAAAAALRQAIAGAVLSTPAAGFIWDAGWRRSGGPQQWNCSAL